MAFKRMASITGFYHVMSRGNNRVEILSKKVDKRKFIRFLSESVSGDPVEIYAYCIMSNHYHLLVKAPDIETLGRTMQRVNSCYAHYYKLKYSHQGHVFQDRFRSKPLNSCGYLANVVRYVHMNPIKAGIANDLTEYEFSSYKEFRNYKKRKILNGNREELLKWLGMSSIKEFERFHHKVEESSEEVKKEIFFEAEEFRYERLSDLRKFERNRVLEMRKEIKNYRSLPQAKKMEFAEIIINSTSSLSLREIAAIAGVGRKKLGPGAPPGPS